MSTKPRIKYHIAEIETRAHLVSVNAILSTSGYVSDQKELNYWNTFTLTKTRIASLKRSLNAG